MTASPRDWPALGGTAARVVVVGASLAGLTAARELRAQGFVGQLVLVGAERHLPYDRPPLSKSFLLGEADETAVGLVGPEDDGLDLDWRLGVPAASLDPGGRRLIFADGTDLVADAVVLATGAYARRLGGIEAGTPHVHLLRTLDDACRLRAALVPGAHVVVVGAGFIGSEVASSAALLGCAVTVVEASATPMERVLGSRMGAVVARWHHGHGVRLLTGTPVLAVRPAAAGAAHPVIVELDGAEPLGADVVVVGAGAAPTVGWLHGSGVGLEDGVRTDARCATNLPGVVAVGDCAALVDPVTGTATRDEHWTSAATRPAVAAETLVSRGRSARTVSEVPYVWSEQYQAHLQFAGRRLPTDRIEVIEGDPATGPFVAVYVRGDAPVAVLAVSSPRSFTRWRRALAGAAAPTSPPTTVTSTVTTTVTTEGSR